MNLISDISHRLGEEPAQHKAAVETVAAACSRESSLVPGHGVADLEGAVVGGVPLVELPLAVVAFGVEAGHHLLVGVEVVPVAAGPAVPQCLSLAVLVGNY